MDSREAIKIGIDTSDFLIQGYLTDLSDSELMLRAAPGINHINWQLGHLISSEHMLVEKVFPGAMPSLPAGFAEKYTKESAASDDPAAFCSKEVLMQAAQEQRAGTLAALAKVSDADLSRETGLDYAPTVAAIFSLQGSHWLMHAGQWVVVRRQTGRPAMF